MDRGIAGEFYEDEEESEEDWSMFLFEKHIYILYTKILSYIDLIIIMYS